MSVLVYLQLAAALAASANEPWDANRVAEFLRLRRSNLQSISFDFEGGLQSGAAGSGGAAIETISGRQRYRADGDRLWIMRVVSRPDSPNPGRTVLLRDAGRWVESAGALADPAVRWNSLGMDAGKHERSGYFHGYITQLALVDRMRGHPGIVVKGREQVSGVDCVVVSHVTSLDGAGNASMEDRYWLAMERDGALMRRETWMMGQKVNETTTLKMSLFESPGGGLWLPVIVQTEYRSLDAEGGKLIVSKAPASTEVMSLIGSSVRINDRIPDELLGRDVSKSLPEMGPQLARERANVRRDTPALAAHDETRRRSVKDESEQQLQELLTKAETQKDLVDASKSLDVPWTDRWRTVGWVVGILLILAAGWVVWRRRASGS